MLRSKTPDVPTFLTLILRRWYRPSADDYANRAILTFDPAKLHSKRQKIRDISSKKEVTVKFRTTSGPSIQTALLRFRAINGGVVQDIPFPAQCRGMFYYHVDPQLPPASGGIRFRLCDSLSTFDKGEDLHISIGKPWNIPLLRIAYTDAFKGLARFLAEEGLVEMNLIQDLRQLQLPSRCVGLHLYHLSQPLIIDLEITGFTIHLVTKKTYSSTLFYSPFYNSHKTCNPYSGLAKVQFELSTRPEHKKKGPTLVIRILEFLSPVQRVLQPDSGPYIEPVTGSFVMRRTVGGNLKPWAYPIDERREGAKWKEFLAASSI